jgi:hypothetical protein
MPKDFSKEFSEAVRAVLAGQDLAAESALRRVIGGLIKDRPKQKNLPLALQLEVFRRDRFTCRFCGRKTVFLPVMLLLSMKFPYSLAYRQENDQEECHLSFMRDSPSCDFLQPPAKGGKKEKANLLTVCYTCHQARENFIGADGQWVVQSGKAEPWDGLLSQYDPLLNKLKASANPYFFEWLKAIKES